MSTDMRPDDMDRVATASDDATVDLVSQVCSAVRGRAGDVDRLVAEEVARITPLASATARTTLTAAVLARLRGLGELEPLLADPSIDEVLVNAGSQIWVDRRGLLSPVGELREHRLDDLIERILSPLGRRLDVTSPIVDARLPDRSRVCAVAPPVAVDGPSLSIRRFADRARPLDDFTDERGIALCTDLLDRRCNIVVAGATSSGKTSLLAALLTCVPPNERIVVVEDTSEMPIPDGHVVRLEGRPPSIDGPPPVTLADLGRAALRLRPDRLVVGEVRGAEVVGLVQALNTGHDGSLATCHANSALDALFRLETLILQAAPNWPVTAIRRQLGRSIDVVVHLAKRPDGRRVIAEIAEVVEAPEGGDLGVRAIAREHDGRTDLIGRPTRSRSTDAPCST